MLRNIKLVIAYDGTDFKGWQVQPGLPTIQGTLAECIRRITGDEVLPQGSGRTDAGVHALAQVVTFPTESPIPVSGLIVALNDLLPTAIRVTSADDVAADFHSRKSAHAKTYRYRIFRDDICSPFVARYVFHHPYPLDEAAMMVATAEVIGEHDFTSFAAVDPERGREDEAPSNVRTIYRSCCRREGQELIYEVRGNGFLQHMVRNLVGTLMLVGKRTLKPGDIRTILAARSRSANPGATAPAAGLCLMNVEY